MSLLRHFRVNYAMVLVMKRGIPCALILKGKTCTHPDPVHIAGNLFSKEVVPCVHASFSTLSGIAVY